MTMMAIQDDICWRCGKKKKLTSHHGIPKHLKPINNVVLPVCEKCHEDINSTDIRSLFAYAHKIACYNKEVKVGIKNLIKILENNIKNSGGN
jgi:hypothetical protein